MTKCSKTSHRRRGRTQRRGRGRTQRRRRTQRGGRWAGAIEIPRVDQRGGATEPLVPDWWESL